MNSTAIARSASVIGREHVRLGKNNQDGVCVVRHPGQLVAVVTDGCSSQPFSEAGARLGARAMASIVAGLDQPLDALPSLAMERLTGWLERLVISTGEPEVVLEQFGLFTVLCGVQRGHESIVFGAGDGVVLIDDRLIPLESGEGNAPDYLGYRLTGRSVPPRTHHHGAARRLAVTTDGLAPWLSAQPTRLAELLDEPQLCRNPVHLQRRLNVLAQTERFGDDATIAVIDARGEA
jgi:hypothetical protein